MFIRNLDYNTLDYYKCNKHIANYLFNKGFVQIGLIDGMYVFKKTEQLMAVIKIMPFHLKIISKLGGDSNGR